MRVVQYYIYEGIDTQKVDENRLKDLERGKTVRVHAHKYGRKCVFDCLTYKPVKKEGY